MRHQLIDLIDGPCAGIQVARTPLDSLVVFFVSEIADHGGCDREVVEHEYKTHTDSSGRLIGVYQSTGRKSLPTIKQVP